jgi:hypothetical protein
MVSRLNARGGRLFGFSVLAALAQPSLYIDLEMKPKHVAFKCLLAAPSNR